MPSAMVVELGLVTVGVLDVVLDSGGREGLLEERTVRGLPASRRGGVGEDDAGLATGGGNLFGGLLGGLRRDGSSRRRGLFRRRGAATRSNKQ